MPDIEARIRVKDDMSPTLNGIVKKVDKVLSKLNAVVTGSGKVTRGFQSASSAAANLERAVSLTGTQLTRVGKLLAQNETSEHKRLEILDKICNLGKLDERQQQRVTQLLDRTNTITRSIGLISNQNVEKRSKILSLEAKIATLRQEELVDEGAIKRINERIATLQSEIAYNEQRIVNAKHARKKITEDIANMGNVDVAIAKERKNLTLQNNQLLANEAHRNQQILDIMQSSIDLENKKTKAVEDSIIKEEQARINAVLNSDKLRWSEWDKNQEMMGRMILQAEDAERKKEQVAINAAYKRDEIRWKEFDSAQESMRRLILQAEDRERRETEIARKGMADRCAAILKESKNKMEWARKTAEFVESVNAKETAEMIKCGQRERAELLKNMQEKCSLALKGSMAAIKARETEAKKFEDATNRMKVAATKQIDAYCNDIKRRQAAEDRAAQRALDNQKKLNAARNAGGYLWGKVKMLGGAYLGVQGAGSVINTADQLAANDARLALMVKEGETVEQLSNKIYEAAMRSRVGYMYMADSVAKVGIQAGNLFGNNDQMVRFMETFGKMAVISKSTTQQTNAAMTQLIQALSFGQLRGDELKSILENMPMVAEVIADELTRMGDSYFKTLPNKLKQIAADSKITADEIRALGYEGQISAETVVNAMLNGSKKIDKMAKNMTWTWAQVWTVFKNHALKAFTPVLNGISKIIQTERFQRFATWIGNLVSRIAKVIQVLWQPVGSVLGWIFDKIAAIGNFISNNWSFIAPIVLGIAAAFMVMKTPLMAMAIWTAICTTATKVWTAAQAVFNAVMAMNPVGLVCLAIIALIVLVYLVVAAINEWCGTTISATGIIAGSVMWLGAVIWDILVGVWNTVLWVLDGILNPIISVCEVIYNAFSNGFSGWISGIKVMFWEFINWAIQMIKPLIEIWDKIKGTNYSSSLQSYVDGKIKGAQGSNYKKFDRNILQKNFSGGYVNPNDAYNSGYNWGKGVEDKLSKFGDIGKVVDPTKQYDNDLIKSLQNGFDNSDAVSNPALDKVAGDTGKIANNSGSAADSLDATSENTKYLRELAEREAINRYTLTDLNVNMTNHNTMNSDVDIDNFGRRLWGALAKNARRAVPLNL